MNISAIVEGLPQVLANLDAFANELETRASGIIQDGATHMKALAEETCPVETGFLRDSHYINRISKFEVEVGNSAIYSEWVNFGHHTKSGSFVPPNNWFSDAWYQTVAEVDAALLRMMSG